MSRYGFYRVAVCSPEVAVGNPISNSESILEMLYRNDVVNANVVVFPELCITGYTCGDLFRQKLLLDETREAIQKIVRDRPVNKQLIFVGAPIPVGNELFNCAVAINDDGVCGIIPKANIPNYSEFYESRWFRAADGNEPKVLYGYNSGRPVPFGTDLIFQSDDLKIFAEICEDLWMPIPPSSYAALAGANLIINLSASNEIVAKNEYRRELVKNQSGRCVAAYAYASAGPSESTTDLVFGGHCLIAENGHILAQTPRVGHPHDPVGLGNWHTVADVDVEKLQTERQLMSSFGDAMRHQTKEYRIVRSYTSCHQNDLKRYVDGTPFVPRQKEKREDRCAEVFGIQCAGLLKRLKQIDFGDIYIGVSGGLDSTLALLVAVKACRKAGVNLERIHGVTLPGFGTTEKTKTNAIRLMKCLGISHETIDIRGLCLETFRAIGHKPFGIDCTDLSLGDFEDLLKNVPKEQRNDLVFENVQARERTKLLMSKGFVLGTGDLSELALGWCTYNGDHMSMYNVNVSVPKTLVKFLVQYVAETQASDLDVSPDKQLKETLLSIVDTKISPELLPPDSNGEIEQSTENVIGPYVLIDFYMSHFMRSGFEPKKLLFLAKHADFPVEYSDEVMKQTLKNFIKRFFTQQFKRSCLPDGVKVGSVSPSPRGDLRMPSDADPTIWLQQIEEL